MNTCIFKTAMIQYVKLFVFHVIVFFTVACSPSDKGGIECLVHSTKVCNESVNLSELLTSYKIIPLETHPDGLIGASIQKIVKRNEHYYIRTDGIRLLEFDESGRFVRKISNQGTGPGEYAYMKDFDVDQDRIAILEYRKIHCFSPDGEYLYSIPLSVNATNIKLLPEGNILLKTNKDIAFCLIDSDGKVVEDFLKMDMALTMGREFGFYKARDKVFYFSSMAANNIWRYDIFSRKGQRVPVFEFPDTISVKEENRLISEVGFEYILNNTNDVKVRPISVSGDFLIAYVYKTEADAMIYFCHLPSNSATGYFVKNITDDILFQPSPASISYAMYGQSEKSFITYLYPYQLEQQKNPVNTQAYRSLQNMFNVLGDENEANPVLFEFIPKY